MNLSKSSAPRCLVLIAAALLLSACAGGAEPLRPAGKPVEVNEATTTAQVTAEPTAAAPAQPGAPAAATTDRQRLAMVEEYQQLVAEIRELRDMVERQQFDLETLQRSYAENMQFMRERLASQQTMIDRLSNQALAPQGGADRYVYNNTERGVSPTEGSPPVGGASTDPTRQPLPSGTQDPATGPGVTTTPPPQGAGDTPRVNAQPVPTGAQPSGDTPAVVAVAASAASQDQYDAAFELLKQSRYEEAIEGFEAFLRDHGNTDLADDAQYWVGEANYVTRAFDAAVASFQTVVDRYPTSSRAGDALLKIGYIQYETGEYDDARKTLNKVVAEYPASRVSNSAETKLQQMTREGR